MAVKCTPKCRPGITAPPWMQALVRLLALPWAVYLPRSAALPRVLALLWVAVMPAAALAETGVYPTVAIIIDDMGNTAEPSDRAVSLPAPMTFAFLPDLPLTPVYAEMAHRRGHEVMLHAPMENHRNLPLGPMAITSTMSSAQIVTTLRAAIATVPHLSGVNNHMGSRLTEDRQAMSIVMDEIGRHPLYFVDSRTSSLSVAHQVADLRGIPTLSRDVFLDHVISYPAIHLQFETLLALARRKGTAIAIGHPYPETLRYLEQRLPRLGEEGFNVASVRGLWAIRNQNRAMFAAPFEPATQSHAQSTRIPSCALTSTCVKVPN